MPWLLGIASRRTHTTLADELGMDLQDRQAMMGHASVAQTMHYTKQPIDRRRDILQGLLEGLLETEGTVQ